MRFGIMAMQIDSLVPSGLPPERVMERLARFDHADLVRELAEHGFNPIELGGDLGMFLPQAYTPEAIERLGALKLELNIAYTVHLPLWSVEPSTPLTSVRLGSVQAVVDMIKAAEPLEPEVYVLHATGAMAAEFYRMGISDLARALILRQFQNGARESLKFILVQTGISSRRLAIETIEFPFELFLELAEELDLSICFDTGHILANFSGPLDFFDSLDKCIPRLAEVHLHDCLQLGLNEIGYGKDHQPLGKGTLDTGKFLDRLSGVGFTGPLIFELRVPEAIQSREVVRSLRPDLV